MQFVALFIELPMAPPSSRAARANAGADDREDERILGRKRA
jgi:hypothetical protein